MALLEQAELARWRRACRVRPEGAFLSRLEASATRLTTGIAIGMTVGSMIGIAIGSASVATPKAKPTGGCVMPWVGNLCSNSWSVGPKPPNMHGEESTEMFFSVYSEHTLKNSLGSSLRLMAKAARIALTGSELE